MPYVNKELEAESKARKCKKVKDWRERTKKRLIAAMGGCCQICSYNRCHKVFDFHHIDPSKKEKSFGNLMRNPTAINDWLGELDKCILLCSNCHREIHAGAVELPSTYARFDKDIFDASKPRVKKIVEKSTYVHPTKIKISNEELFKKFAEHNNNYSSLGRELGVSDNAIRKRLTIYQLDGIKVEINDR